MKRAARRLGVSLGTLLVLLLVGELPYRLWRFGPQGLDFDALDTAVPISQTGALRAAEGSELSYELAPNVDLPFKFARLETNDAGLRGRGTLDPPVHERPRVLVLGDSFTMGSGVALEETWPVRMEANLAARGIPCEVLNLGVAGYGLRDYTYVLRERAPPLQPSVVVVAITPNDFRPQLRARPDYVPKPRTRPSLRLHLLGDLLAPILGSDADEDEADLRPDELLEPQKGYVFRRLKRLRNDAAFLKVPLLVLSLRTTSEETPQEFEYRSVAEEIGLPYADAGQRFEAAERPADYWIYRADAHPNGRANALFAEVAADLVAPWVPRRSAAPADEE